MSRKKIIHEDKGRREQSGAVIAKVSGMLHVSQKRRKRTIWEMILTCSRRGVALSSGQPRPPAPWSLRLRPVLSSYLLRTLQTTIDTDCEIWTMQTIMRPTLYFPYIFLLYVGTVGWLSSYVGYRAVGYIELLKCRFGTFAQNNSPMMSRLTLTPIDKITLCSGRRIGVENLMNCRCETLSAFQINAPNLTCSQSYKIQQKLCFLLSLAELPRKICERAVLTTRSEESSLKGGRQCSDLRFSLVCLRLQYKFCHRNFFN